MTEQQLLETLLEGLKAGKKAAMAFNIEATEASPAKEGAALLVFDDQKVYGTVGGGAIEKRIIEDCREALGNNRGKPYTYKLKDVGMICGGTVSGFIKVFNQQPLLLIAGGGHVGQALYSLACKLPFRIAVYDSRQEYAKKDLFPAAIKVSTTLDDFFTDITGEVYGVSAAFNHQEDQQIMQAFLSSLDSFRYLGLIGSHKKIEAIFSSLHKKGLTDAIDSNKNNIFAPVGLDIAHGNPQEIAMAVMAEILMVKNEGRAKSLRQEKLYIPSIE